MVMMLAEQISALDREIARRAKEEDMPSRLMTIPCSATMKVRGERQSG
jgi:hypothetical protein